MTNVNKSESAAPEDKGADETVSLSALAAAFHRLAVAVECMSSLFAIDDDWLTVSPSPNPSDPGLQ
jgi:hypothetical protein